MARALKARLDGEGLGNPQTALGTLSVYTTGDVEILRKAYGGAYIAMNSKTLGADRVYAWPNAEVAVMGESGAVEILYAKEARPLPEGEKDAFLQKKAIEYRQQMMNCDRALKMGFVDEMIFPEQTREKLVHTMKGLLKKRRPFSSGKRHGCIPL